MLLTLNDDGGVFSTIGYRSDYTDSMLDGLLEQADPESKNLLIKDSETIERVWMALDTGGLVKVELDDEGNVLRVITENGELEPPKDVPSEPEPTEIEVLQRENLMLQLALAETIEKQETDKLNSQLAVAELVETLIIKGVL